MRRRRIPLVILLTALICLIVAPGLHAQNPPPQPVVVYSITEPRGDRVDLTIYFAFRDANGDPVLRDAIELDERNATMQLLAGDVTPVAASVSEAQDPIKIVLLMDASGSMQPLIGEVRAAAIKALEVAPENAVFAVFQFNEIAADQALIPLQDFTSNRDLVAQAINTVTPRDQAPTCLFNASFLALSYLNQNVAPGERRALIVFTDGRDERTDGQPCSQRTAENVITAARELNAPVYTVGLCTGAACSNTDPRVLETIADDTRGIDAVGPRDQVEGLFRVIMEELSSQWVARATLCPRAGFNQAVLTMPLRDSGVPVSLPFSFEAATDCAPPPAFELTPRYDAEGDRYLLDIAVTNPGSLRDVTIETWDNTGKTQLRTQTLTPGDLDAPIEVRTSDFEAGRTYCFRLRATGQAGQALTTAEGAAILVEQCVEYESNLSFVISSVDPDWDQNKLRILVDVRGAGQDRPTFDLTIVTEGRQRVTGVDGIEPNDDGYITIDLPARLRQADPDEQFILTLTLNRAAEPIEQVEEFAVTPPPAPSLALPIALGGLLVIGLAVLGWVVMRRVQAQPQVPRMAPYTPPTSRLEAPVVAPPPSPVVPAPRPPAPRVRLQVTRTVSPEMQRAVEFTDADMPVLIGREDGNHVVIKGDPGLGRRHAQLSFSGGTFLITDLNSTNGTYIGEQRLTPNTPTPISARTAVRLGPNTVLEIEPRA